MITVIWDIRLPPHMLKLALAVKLQGIYLYFYGSYSYEPPRPPYPITI